MPGRRYGDTRYGDDVLAAPSRRPEPPPRIPAEHGLVVEDGAGEFCGAVVGCEKDALTLEDRFGNRRVFPLTGTFLLEGKRVATGQAGAGSTPGAQPDRIRVCRGARQPGESRQGQPDLRGGQTRRRARGEGLGR